MRTWVGLHRGEITGTAGMGYAVGPDGEPLTLRGPERATAAVTAVLVAARTGETPGPVPSIWLVMFESWRRLAAVEALAAAGRPPRPARRGRRPVADRRAGLGARRTGRARAGAVGHGPRDRRPARPAGRRGVRTARHARRRGRRRGSSAGDRPAWRRRPDLALLDRLGARPLAARARALLGGQAAAVDGPPQLSPREREVAELVADGLSNAAIAERLVVSVRTVTSHLDHAYTKLGSGRARSWPARSAAADTHFSRCRPYRRTPTLPP